MIRSGQCTASLSAHSCRDHAGEHLHLIDFIRSPVVLLPIATLATVSTIATLAAVATPTPHGRLGTGPITHLHKRTIQCTPRQHAILAGHSTMRGSRAGEAYSRHLRMGVERNVATRRRLRRSILRSLNRCHSVSTRAQHRNGRVGHTPALRRRPP